MKKLIFSALAGLLMGAGFQSLAGDHGEGGEGAQNRIEIEAAAKRAAKAENKKIAELEKRVKVLNASLRDQKAAAKAAEQAAKRASQDQRHALVSEVNLWKDRTKSLQKRLHEKNIKSKEAAASKGQNSIPRSDLKLHLCLAREDSAAPKTALQPAPKGGSTGRR